jgi:hypothetical protein
MTVPNGHPNLLVRRPERPYHEASQADSAGSIPVTRSHVKAQVSGHAQHGYLARRPLVDLHGPLNGPLLDLSCTCGVPSPGWPWRALAVSM